MGLFERKTCIRCGKELGLIFGKIKISDGYICKDCNALLSPLLTGKNNLSLNQIEEHIAYRKQNKDALNNFKATTILGDNTKIFFDDNQKKFLINSTNNYIEKNVDIFNLDEISSCQLDIETEKEEIFTTDKDGNEISYDPAKFEVSYNYKININLSHKWIHSLTIDVAENVKDDDPDELLRVDNLANEIVAKLTNKEFIIKNCLDNQDDYWICSKCGQKNDISSKYCTNCGEVKVSGQKFCSECGTKLSEGIKFCPNCGKAVG